MTRNLVHIPDFAPAGEVGTEVDGAVAACDGPAAYRPRMELLRLRRPLRDYSWDGEVNSEDDLIGKLINQSDIVWTGSWKEIEGQLAR